MAWRSRYKWVDMNPYQLPTRLWKGPMRVEEYFARQAVGVCELYSHSLAKATPVPAHHYWIALQPIDPEHPSNKGFVPGYLDPAPRADEHEHLSAWLDPVILELPGADRPEAYLRWLQPILLGLADVRGVPATGFEEAFDATLAAGCLMTWEAPRRSSPDRRYRATAHYEIDADGDAWVRLVVHDRHGATVAEGGPWDSLLTFREWRRQAKTLTWTTPTEVRIAAYPELRAKAWGVEAAHSLLIG